MMRSLLAPIALGLSLAACGTSQKSSLHETSDSTVLTYDFTDGVTVPHDLFFSDFSIGDKTGATEGKRNTEIPGYAAKVKKFVEKNKRQPDAFEIGNLVVGTGNLYQTKDQTSLASAPDVKGIVLTHINRSDDVDTNIVIKLAAEQGIEAGAAYEISAEVEFYSNTPTGGFGIGGAPDAIQYGVSVSGAEWTTASDGSHYRTFTNGVQSTNPSDGDADYAPMNGKLNNGLEDGEDRSHDFLLNSLHTEHAIYHESTGAIYVNFRTHSGYEGYSIWAVKSVKITVKPTAKQTKN